jgi:hypothetical protein
VGWPQALSGLLLIAAILAAAALLAGREWAALRRLDAAPEDDRPRLRRQAYRRLVGCALLTALGVLLAGALLFLEGPAQALADFRDAQPGREFDDEQRRFARLWGWYWMAVLLLLLAVVLLAAFDLWAVRRHALRERRRLLADRRALLEEQAARRRHGRNGQ